MRDVTDLAVERARAHGIAGIALRNSSHAGRIADFCARGARGGVAILFWFNDSGGGRNVAPYGGDAARLATNPIGAGIPRASEPHLVLDMSTSVIARGRLAEWLDRGEEIGPDWLTPGGAIRPSGGYKGTGPGAGGRGAGRHPDRVRLGLGDAGVRRAGRLLRRDRHRPAAAAGRLRRRDGADARLRPRRAARARARRRPASPASRAPRPRPRASATACPCSRSRGTGSRRWPPSSAWRCRRRSADGEHDLAEPRRVVETAERVVRALEREGAVDHRAATGRAASARAAPRTRAGCPSSSRGCCADPSTRAPPGPARRRPPCHRS